MSRFKNFQPQNRRLLNCCRNLVCTSFCGSLGISIATHLIHECGANLRLVRSLIYFTRELPGLSEDLSEHGFQVYEALAVSEALYLCQQHPTLVVVIDHTVEPDASNEIAARHITLRLKKKAIVPDVVWELSALASDARVH
jgi:hypothetical protein